MTGSAARSQSAARKKVAGSESRAGGIQPAGRDARAGRSHAREGQLAEGVGRAGKNALQSARGAVADGTEPPAKWPMVAPEVSMEGAMGEASPTMKKKQTTSTSSFQIPSFQIPREAPKTTTSCSDVLRLLQSTAPHKPE